MKYQPNANYSSDDVVMTPPELAARVVTYLNPTGKFLDPARGQGAFWSQVPNAEWCELAEGRDFMDYAGQVDYIITNPPWSRISDFLRKGLEVSNNVAYLMTINHAFTAYRMRIVKEAGASIRNIITFQWPKSFPKSGFSLGVVHYQKGWTGDIKHTDWT